MNNKKESKESKSFNEEIAEMLEQLSEVRGGAATYTNLAKQYNGDSTKMKIFIDRYYTS